MTKRNRTRALVGATAASAMLALAGPLAPGAAAAGCTPKSNVEAIIDDSESMKSTDANELRAQGMTLLIDSLPASTTLGAIEFGSSLIYLGIPPANSIFQPGPIGPNATAMKEALAAAIDGGHYSTDYNGAFALADTETRPRRRGSSSPTAATTKAPI